MRLLILLPSLLLAGCAAVPDRPAPALPSTGVSARYLCADGRAVEVLYSGGDAAAVTLAGRTVEMARAPAADGERYTGGGWQWWGKGQREGTLAPLVPGETAASAAGVSCRVG